MQRFNKYGIIMASALPLFLINCICVGSGMHYLFPSLVTLLCYKIYTIFPSSGWFGGFVSLSSIAIILLSPFFIVFDILCINHMIKNKVVHKWNIILMIINAMLIILIIKYTITFLGLY